MRYSTKLIFFRNITTIYIVCQSSVQWRTYDCLHLLIMVAGREGCDHYLKSLVLYLNLLVF